MLRLAVPLVVVGGVILYSIFTWLNPLRLLTHLPAQVGHLVVSGTKITMEHPRLAGFTRDARAYEMTAHAAAQDIMNPDKMELEGVRAKFETAERAVVNVTAASGFYDSKADLLRLTKDVLITSTSGYEVMMSEALIDIRTSHVVSDLPVTVKMMSGTIHANRLEVSDSGATISFSGGVVMNLTGTPAANAETAQDEQ